MKLFFQQKTNNKKEIIKVDGSYYHNSENAYEAARQLVDKVDLYQNLQNRIDLWDLFNWCFQENSFLERFQDEILEAEEDAMEDYVHKIEFLDEEDEKQYFEFMNPEFLDEEEEEE